VDIETKGTMITCVGFAPSKERSLVVPFFDASQKDGNYWRSREEERLAWRFVERVLRDHGSFGQNFQYDMQYLWRYAGIAAKKFCDDTMLLHHALQPEMQKGLGFLASVYTDELAWKFMHKVSASDRGAKKGDVE
jgi:DNA polymerase I-like protein with 3'-5' exonuclease and polymerase domains